MKNKKYPWEEKKLGFVIYLLTSWLPISRRKHNKRYLEVLEVLASHREFLMMTRQDIMLLANKMMKFHGKELMSEKKAKNTDSTTQSENKFNDENNMYG